MKRENGCDITNMSEIPNLVCIFFNFMNPISFETEVSGSINKNFTIKTSMYSRMYDSYFIWRILKIFSFKSLVNNSELFNLKNFKV